MQYLLVAVLGTAFGWYIATSSGLQETNDSTQAINFAVRYCKLSEDAQYILDEQVLMTPKVQVKITCS